MLVQKLVQPSKIERWAVVNFNARCDLRGLVSNLIKCGETKGVVSNGSVISAATDNQVIDIVDFIF